MKNKLRFALWLVLWAARFPFLACAMIDMCIGQFQDNLDEAAHIDVP